MSDDCLRKPRSMGSLLPPNYVSDDGRFDLNLPRIRPAWLMNESIKSLDSKFPMVPAPTGSIVFYTTPLGEKLRQMPKDREFDLTDPLRPCLSYNYLHDQHLQMYFKSNDIRKRLQDEGFITDDGYVKCSLKEFNQYRQWIRKLKLDELNRERRQDEKQVEEAKKERLERIALERDPELLELMKRRREKRREEAKMHQKRIKKEQDRLRKLEEIDRQRREKFMDMRRKSRDRIQIKRDLERERLRKKKCDHERQGHEVKLRIMRKMKNKNDTRMKNMEEKKEQAKQRKTKNLEEQWKRRQSWSIEHHEHQKRLRELQTREFQEHVEERNAKVARQRRLSQVSFNEIAEANRRTFESRLEKAEVFLAQLNLKKEEELKKWRTKFDAMRKMSLNSMNSNPNIITKFKKRSRRQSSWDLESCLLKDLGIAEQEIKENSYSKLGVISRTIERGFMGDTMGSLLEEVDDGGQQDNEEFCFSIPTIVESFASLREPSSDESDSDSEYSPRIPSVFRFESLHDLQLISDAPEVKPNAHIPEDKLRKLVSDYVQGILRTSADTLGVDIKFQERTRKEEIPRITDMHTIPNLKTKEMVPDDCGNMRAKVREYLSGILDKVEDKMQISIKRPGQYEKIRQEKQSAAQPMVESAGDVVDSTLHGKNKKNAIRLYVCKIVEDAASQCQVEPKFPPDYQPFVKRHHRPGREHSANAASNKHVSEMADRHTVVLRAIADGTMVLESAIQETSNTINCHSVADEIKRTASAIGLMRNKYDKVRAARLFHENLLMIATRTVVQALNEAVQMTHAHRRNSDFFMADLPNLCLTDVAPTSHKEEAVVLKEERTRQRRESLKSNETEHIPREVDFLTKATAKKNRRAADKKGEKNTSFERRKQGEKKIAELEKLYNTSHNSGKKAGPENKGKAGKESENKKNVEKKKDQGTGDNCKVGEKTGKESENDEKEIRSSSQNVSPSFENETVTVPAKKILQKEASNKELVGSVERIPKQPGEIQVTKSDKTSTESELHVSEVKSSLISESKFGNKLGDDGVEAPVSTLSMKSPSLPQVTPQPSGFGLVSDSVRSGALPADDETTFDPDRRAAKSPSSAIFRMISMRETRESCDLSPEPSYVVLPTLTSSECALINSRMTELFKNDESKAKGMEPSSPSFPSLTATASRETHPETSITVDHRNNLVKLPSVPSVESCPSRTATPVRSPSRSSQVALPQIDGSSTSLVGNNETTQVTGTESEAKTNKPAHSNRTKTPPAKPNSVPKVKPSSAPQAQKLQTGRTAVRRKSEISRKATGSVPLPQQKGQAHSTTAIITRKTSISGQQRKSRDTAKPAEGKTPDERKKTLDAVTATNRPAMSKSTGEAIIATRNNSHDVTRNKRRSSEATARADSIAKHGKVSDVATKSTNRKSSMNVKAEKINSSSQQRKKSDTQTSNLTSKLSNSLPGKFSQNAKTKQTSEIYAKSTQDVHAKSTQNVHLKSTTSPASKIVKPDGKEVLKTEHRQTPHTPASAANLTELTVQELKTKTKPGEDIESSATDVPTASEPLPSEMEANANSPDSFNSTKFSPSLSPESPSSPTEKPQAMIGAQINSPDIEELSRSIMKSSITVLNVTESEKDLYSRESNYGNLGDSQDDEPADKDLGDDSGSKRRKISSGNKPRVSKGKKKLIRNKPKDDDDGTKTTDGGSKITDFAPTITDCGPKISDGRPKIIDAGPKIAGDGAKTTDRVANIAGSKTKVSDDVKQKNSDNVDSKISRKSIDGALKNNKGNRSRSNSKGSSILAMSKPSQEESKVSKSRRTSRSVSFSSTVPKPKPKKESVDSLTKRRSSQKVAKKASSKELKKRRSSLSSEHAKSKVKSSAELVAKVESSAKVSKTHKKSSKDVVAQKAKSQDKTQLDTTQNTGVDISRETRAEDRPEIRVKASKETPVEASKETRVEALPETQLEENHPADLHKTHVDDTHDSRVDDSQNSRVDDSQNSCVGDEQKTREGSNDSLKKSTESDLEIVVQVYVPDDGHTDVPDQASKPTFQESGGKSKVLEKKDHVKEGTQGISRINLDLFPEESTDSGVKKTPSRRGLFDNAVDKNLVNIVPRNSMDIIKGSKLTPSAPSETNVTSKRSFHSKTNLHRVPKPPSRVARRIPSESRPLKVSNFELPNARQGGGNLKPTLHSKSQVSMHRLASKMSTNLEKVDEGSALETSQQRSCEESERLTKALNISKVSATTKPVPSSSGTERFIEEKTENLEKNSENSEEKTNKQEENGEKKENEKVDTIRGASNKSLQILMKTSGVCINSASFADVVQGTPLLSKDSATNATNDVTGNTSSASVRSNSSLPLVPSPPVTAKPDVVSPRISRMMSRHTSNCSGKSRGSHGSANTMSPTASMEIVKLASNSSHGWVSSPTSSVKFLPPIDARASKASNRSDDSSTKRRPRTAESAASHTGSVGSGTSSGFGTKAAVVEIRRSGSGDLRIDGSSSGLVVTKSSSSAGSPKQTVVGF